MKTLGEIINAVRTGHRPDYDELRYAVCALEALSTFDDMALRKLVEAEMGGKKPVLVWSAEFQHTERFNRWRRALNTDPKSWVGWDNDPDNPYAVKRRETAIKLIDKWFAS